MWKKRILCLVLVLCAVLLTACQGNKEKEIYPDTQPTPTPTKAPAPDPTPVPGGTTSSAGGQIDFDDPRYNPEAEEGGQDEEIVLVITAAPSTPAPIITSEYAGATPVVIDPIDKPTPTPVPKITFKDSDYTTYELNAMHLKFQAPAGWIADDSQTDTFTLTNPDLSMDYAAQIRIRVVPVNKQYTKNELVKEVKEAVKSLRDELGLTNLDTYSTPSIDFLKTIDQKGKANYISNKGIYTRYKGTVKETGAKVEGRVIANCYNKTLYILYVSYPGRDSDLVASFEEVYRTVRTSLVVTQ